MYTPLCQERGQLLLPRYKLSAKAKQLVWKQGFPGQGHSAQRLVEVGAQADCWYKLYHVYWQYVAI